MCLKLCSRVISFILFLLYMAGIVVAFVSNYWAYYATDRLHSPGVCGRYALTTSAKGSISAMVRWQNLAILRIVFKLNVTAEGDKILFSVPLEVNNNKKP